MYSFPSRDSTAASLSHALRAVAGEQACAHGIPVGAREQPARQQDVERVKADPPYEFIPRRATARYDGPHPLKDIGRWEQTREILHPRWKRRHRIEHPGERR